MANEFIIKNGFVSKGNSIVEGILSGQTFNLINTPVNNNSATEILVRNSTTGVVEYRDSSTLSGGGGQTITGYTYDETTNKFSIDLSGGTSFDTTISVVSGLTVTNDLIVSGNTGIGTDTPTEKLHIKSTTNAKIKIEADINDVDDTDTADILLSQDGGISTSNIGMSPDSINDLVIGVNSTTNPSIKFATRNDGTTFSTTADTKMTLSNDGKLGIGTIPTEKLDVDGKVRIRDGAVNGYVLTSDANGVGTWLPTSGTNTFVTGATLNGTDLEIDRNDGQSQITVDLSSLAVDNNVFVDSGNANAATRQLTFTNTTGGTFNVTNAAALFSDNDINVTGGTYSPNTGCVTFKTNSGDTFDICGFVTGLTNTFVSGGTYDSSTSELTFTNTTGGTFNVDLSSLSGGTLWQTENGGLKSYTPTTGSINGTSTGSLIAGGFSTNEIFSSPGSTILNGSSNVISGSTTSALLSTQNSSIKSNPSAVSDISHATIVGGLSNTIEDTTAQPSERATIVGGSSNIINGGLDSAIIGGSDNTIVEVDSGIYTSTQSVISGGSSSAIIGGRNHLLSGNNSIILGGNGITGTSDNTVYVPNLNIGTVGGGAPLINLGLDSNGNIVTGSTSGGGTMSFTVEGDNGTPFTISSGDTLEFVGFPGIDVGVADPEVRIALDYSGADSFILAATNGTGITVDGANDKLVIYDNDTATVKYINANQLPSSGAASTPITGYSYNPTSNTFTIGLSGGTSFDSQILEVSGITVNGDITLSQIPTLNNSETAILVRNNSTGEVEYREASTLTGSTDTNTFVTGGTLSTDSLLTLGYNNGGFASSIDLSTLMDGGDTITGFTYDKTNNTFSIGVSGKTSFDSQILKVSGITVENSMELGEYIRHSGDTNTYFGFNGTDSIVAFTNASRKLRIGTNAVDLEYNGSTKLSTISDGVFVDGNLGVGTDNPLENLDVRGDVLISNPSNNSVLTLSGTALNDSIIDFDNNGVSTPFARIEGSTFGGGVSGNLQFYTYPTGGPLSEVMVLTNNQRVGIGDITNNDVDKTLHVMGDFKMEETGAIFESDLNLNSGANVKLSAITTDQLARIAVATPGNGGITFGVRGSTETSFPGYGAKGDGYLYSSIHQNGLNIISAPGTDTEDYIRFFAGNDADGNTANMFIAGTGDTKGYVGINTETPTAQLFIQGDSSTSTGPTDPDNFSLQIQNSLNQNILLVKNGNNGVAGSTAGRVSINGNFGPSTPLVDDDAVFSVLGDTSSLSTALGSVMAIKDGQTNTLHSFYNNAATSLAKGATQYGKVGVGTTTAASIEAKLHVKVGDEWKDTHGNDFTLRVDGLQNVAPYTATTDNILTLDNFGNLNIKKRTTTENFTMTSGATNGYVLTCDANGVGSWQPSSGGTGTVFWQTENGGLKSINQNAGTISGTSTGAILVGGYFTTNNITDGRASTIINGGSNTISGASASAIISTTNSSIIGNGSTIQYSVIVGGQRNTINGSSDNALIGGGTNNEIIDGPTASIIGGTNNTIDDCRGGIYTSEDSELNKSFESVIIGGSDHIMDASSRSVIVGGINNLMESVTRSVILGGQNITGDTSDTVYVPNLNINSIGNGTPIGNLGFDSSGNVVTGTTGSATSFWEEAGLSNEVLIDEKGSSSYTVNGESNGAIIAAGTGHTISNSKYASFLGGVGNVTSNSTSTLGADTQLGGFGNTISGRTALSFNNVMLGGSSNIIFSSARGAMLSTSDSRMSACTDSFILGGSNHKNGSGNNGLAQNDNSGIVGGTNNTFDIGVDRSVIIGGTGLNATTNDTVYVPNLNINSIGNGTPIGNLGFDSNGNVVTGTTGVGSSFSWSDPLVSSGNTSTDCLTNLYVANLRSCSPLYINPGDEGDVYFGSNSGVTIQTSFGKMGIGTQTPISKLHINNGNVLISNEDAILAISSTTVGGSGEYENRINFKSAGSNQSDKIDAQLRTESSGTRSNLFFGTIASNTLSDKMILTGRGRLGLGTMSPDSTLHISGSNIQQLHIESSNSNAVLKLKSDDGNNAYIDFDETSGNRWLMGSYSVNDKFVWATGNTFSTGGLMALTQNGDLGVGNISPSSRLHVNISSLPSLPTLGNDNVALFESDNETEVAIVGTEDRNVTLKFGDENSLDGIMRYDNLNKEFGFQTDGINVLELTTENVVNEKVVQLSEFGVGDPLYTLHVSRSGSTGNYKYNIISGNTGLSSDSCLDEFYVTNLESCSPLYINSQNQGDVYFGDQGGGIPTVTLDITTVGEPAMYFGQDSFVKYNETDKKLIIGEDETDGIVVVKASGTETLEVSPTKTKLLEGDLEAEEGNIIIKSGNSKSLIVEDIPDVGGANLGTNVDGKLIDIPSDSRVKQNILELGDVVDPLNFIQQVSAYQFEFKPETRISSVGKKHYGFKVDDFRDNLISAGKLTDLTPDELVINNIAKTLVKRCKTSFTVGNSQLNEVDAMNYQDLIPFMIEGIKQLDTNINNISSGGSNKFVTTQTLSSGQNIINHNLNDENVIVQVIEVGTGQLIIPNKVSNYLPNSVAIDVETGGEHKIIIIA